MAHEDDHIPVPEDNPTHPNYNGYIPPPKPKTPITPEAIMAHAEELSKKAQAAALQQKGMLTIKQVNEWMEEARKEPIPNMLFDVLWHENELCILFADTNVGKSILAVQIGNSISSGTPIPGFRLETAAQRVLYFDFEMSKKQFENRYTCGYEDPYQFHPNFLRVEINRKGKRPDNYTFEEYLNLSLEMAIADTGARILIIDNLTYLRTDNEKASDAAPFMQHLADLKEKYHLSMLVLAHTPKRDPSQPLTENDVQGSSMLTNLIDSAIAIGKSHQDVNLRYIKQVKQRETAAVYHAGNVCICRIAKPHNFLGFELTGYDSESAHLRKRQEVEKEEKQLQVQELHKLGKSLKQISDELGIPKTNVYRLLNKGD